MARGDDGICVSFNEPTLLFEFSLDLFTLARKEDKYCCFVSNGYMTTEALDALIEAGLDGMNVDVKGRQEAYDRYCGGPKVRGVWELAAYARRQGVHIEVVSLLVTGVSDDETTVRWIIDQHLEALGPDVPLHFTRYFPARSFTAPLTPLDHMERAWRWAKDAGIHYVYLGNLRGRGEDTHCPRCGSLLIRRQGFATLEVHLTEDNCCPHCRNPLPIVGRARPSSPSRFD